MFKFLRNFGILMFFGASGTLGYILYKSEFSHNEIVAVLICAVVIGLFFATYAWLERSLRARAYMAFQDLVDGYRRPIPLKYEQEVSLSVLQQSLAKALSNPNFREAALGELYDALWSSTDIPFEDRMVFMRRVIDIIYDFELNVPKFKEEHLLRVMEMCQPEERELLHQYFYHDPVGAVIGQLGKRKFFFGKKDEGTSNKTNPGLSLASVRS